MCCDRSCFDVLVPVLPISVEFGYLRPTARGSTGVFRSGEGELLSTWCPPLGRSAPGYGILESGLHIFACYCLLGCASEAGCCCYQLPVSSAGALGESLVLLPQKSLISVLRAPLSTLHLISPTSPSDELSACDCPPSLVVNCVWLSYRLSRCLMVVS